MSASPQIEEKPRLPKRTGLEVDQHVTIAVSGRTIGPNPEHLVPRPTCNGTVLIVVHHIAAVSAETGSPDPTPRPFRGTAGPQERCVFLGPGRVGAPMMLTVIAPGPLSAGGSGSNGGGAGGFGGRGGFGFCGIAVLRRDRGCEILLGSPNLLDCAHRNSPDNYELPLRGKLINPRPIIPRALN